MLAPHIKKKVDELWNRFWSAGLTNPLVAVEQITYLIFLKRLEDIDKNRAKAAEKVGKPYVSIYAPRDSDPKGMAPEKCKWSYIQQEKNNVQNLTDNVFPWLRTIESRLSRQTGDDELVSLNDRMKDAYFQLDSTKGQVLEYAIDRIDQLFARAGDGSAAQDIMGDTFEYLLDEMATAGKNGQFRTPRHLIRFMVELLDPEPGQRVIDPAAGTGGFLFSAQQYMMKKYTATETRNGVVIPNFVLEWDGAPHRIDGAKAPYLKKEVVEDGERLTRTYWQLIHDGRYFVGLDNDRTMARIGWMNLVLHDIHNPHLVQGDSLSERKGKPAMAELLEPESYDFVLANPPFTGNVDSIDLDNDSTRFPKGTRKVAVPGTSDKKTLAITDKSELLFLWLMLDLLAVGGNCAVIIPEGVLFGNTDAHRQLRRELLTEHIVEGIISLPAGVFQPYTGVKTSILLFKKVTPRKDKKSVKEQEQSGGPQNLETEFVWFYDVETDGYADNAKRTPMPGQQNDLWDALVKFRAWIEDGRVGALRNEKTLLQPSFSKERWRQALLRGNDDSLTPAGVAFSGLTDLSMWNGQVWGIHELFRGLPSTPKEAEEKIRAIAESSLLELAIQVFTPVARKLWDDTLLRRLENKILDTELLEFWKTGAKPVEAKIKKQARELEKFFERDDSFALPIWRSLLREALSRAQEDHFVLGLLNGNQPPQAITSHNINERLEFIAREVAKLDGFDVDLRSLAVDQTRELKAAKHWVIPVREWLRDDEWQSADGSLKSSHDENGLVRPQYVAAMLEAGLYDEKGQLKGGLLDPDCIEARDWNLSAGQYKPFDFTQLRSDKSVSELIGELRGKEKEILSGLDKLLAMVEGRE